MSLFQDRGYKFWNFPNDDPPQAKFHFDMSTNNKDTWDATLPLKYIHGIALISESQPKVLINNNCQSRWLTIHHSFPTLTSQFGNTEDCVEYHTDFETPKLRSTISGVLYIQA